jgi:hypothetical protein
MPSCARKTYAERAAGLDIQLVESNGSEGPRRKCCIGAQTLRLRSGSEYSGVPSYGQRNESARNMQRHVT